MTVNLQEMSHKELLKLRDDIDSELKAAEKRERQQALQAAEDAAAKFGYSLDDLAAMAGSKRGKTRRARSAPKFRNPSDHSQTWTGLGRKPQWFHDEMAKGTDVKQLEI